MQTILSSIDPPTPRELQPHCPPGRHETLRRLPTVLILTTRFYAFQQAGISGLVELRTCNRCGHLVTPADPVLARVRLAELAARAGEVG